MPYFVYKIITPLEKFELIQTFDNYKEAGIFAKSQRAAMQPDDKFSIKIIFAGDTLKAEKLLTEKREPEPMIGDDY